LPNFSSVKLVSPDDEYEVYRTDSAKIFNAADSILFLNKFSLSDLHNLLCKADPQEAYYFEDPSAKNSPSSVHSANMSAKTNSSGSLFGSERQTTPAASSSDSNYSNGSSGGSSVSSSASNSSLCDSSPICQRLVFSVDDLLSSPDSRSAAIAQDKLSSSVDRVSLLLLRNNPNDISTRQLEFDWLGAVYLSAILAVENHYHDVLSIILGELWSEVVVYGRYFLRCLNIIYEDNSLVDPTQRPNTSLLDQMKGSRVNGMMQRIACHLLLCCSLRVESPMSWSYKGHKVEMRKIGNEYDLICSFPINFLQVSGINEIIPQFVRSLPINTTISGSTSSNIIDLNLNTNDNSNNNNNNNNNNINNSCSKIQTRKRKATESFDGNTDNDCSTVSSSPINIISDSCGNFSQTSVLLSSKEEILAHRKCWKKVEVCYLMNKFQLPKTSDCLLCAQNLLANKVELINWNEVRKVQFNNLPPVFLLPPHQHVVHNSIYTNFSTPAIITQALSWHVERLMNVSIDSIINSPFDGSVSGPENVMTQIKSLVENGILQPLVSLTCCVVLLSVSSIYRNGLSY
jgi:hypothetical protein